MPAQICAEGQGQHRPLLRPTEEARNQALRAWDGGVPEWSSPKLNNVPTLP